MATLKTQPNDNDVSDFLNSVAEDKKRAESFKLLEIMQELTNEPAKMWGQSIVGFGTYHYKYESGREGDFFKVGFSPRKQSLTVYIMPGFERFDKLMADLGKYKTGKSCLYIKSLDDVDMKTLKTLISHSVSYMNKKYD